MHPVPLDPCVTDPSGAPVSTLPELRGVERVSRVAGLVKYAEHQLDELVGEQFAGDL